MEQQVLSLVVCLNFGSCKTCGSKQSCLESFHPSRQFYFQNSEIEFGKCNGSLSAASASVPDTLENVFLI